MITAVDMTPTSPRGAGLFPLLSPDDSEEGEDAPLAVEIGTHEEEHVLDAHDQKQGPEDEGEHPKGRSRDSSPGGVPRKRSP